MTTPLLPPLPPLPIPESEIARLAYEISQSPACSTPQANWEQARHELELKRDAYFHPAFPR